MSNDFNPYHKWLGIPEKKCPPTYYELLGISLDEEDKEVIKIAAQRQKTHVEQFLASDHSNLVKQLIYQIDEAEFTILSPELRREYDRKEKLFKKRRRNRQIDPIAVSSHIPFSGGTTVGEETGFVRQYAGIMTVLLVGFMVMAGFSFWLPWEKLEKSEGNAPAVQDIVVEVKHNTKQPKIKIAIKPDVVQQPQGDLNFPKPVLSVTFDKAPNSEIRLDNRGTTFVAGKIGKAMKCDGKSFAIVPVSNLPSGKSPRTIAVWLKNIGVSANNNRHAISYGRHNPPSSLPCGIVHLKNKWGHYGAGAQVHVETDMDNEWHHHCLSYDGKTLVYRIDGKIVGKTAGTMTTSAGPLVLGTYDENKSFCFEGLIDEIMVYNKALSTEQVQMLIESQDAVAERISSAAPGISASVASSRSDEVRKGVNVLENVDPKRHTLLGQWTKDGNSLMSHPSPKKEPSVILVPFHPNGEYKLHVIAKNNEAWGALIIGLANNRAQFGAFCAASGKSWLMRREGGKNNKTSRSVIFFPSKKPVSITCTVRRNGVVVESDNGARIHWQGDYSTFKKKALYHVDIPDRQSLFLGAWGKFEVMEMRWERLK